MWTSCCTAQTGMMRDAVAGLKAALWGSAKRCPSSTEGANAMPTAWYEEKARGKGKQVFRMRAD